MTAGALALIWNLCVEVSEGFSGLAELIILMIPTAFIVLSFLLVYELVIQREN